MAKNKIIIIVAMALVAVLAATTIILSVVKINYAPQISKPSIIYVKTSNDDGSFTETNENFDKILEEYNKSYTRSVMSAIFAGQNSTAINLTENGTLPTVNQVPAAENLIRLKYEEPQVLKINGKELDGKFKEVYVQVSNNASFAVTEVYFKQNSDVTAYYLLKTYANQAGLYELIQSLFE